jgi:hypothetical protein
MILSWWMRRRQSPSAQGTPSEGGGEAGRQAGRREVEALEAVRAQTFTDRAEQQLHEQLARAPRDVGALFGLLQWHVRRGEKAQAESFAHALWDETDAEGELWRRAAALGRSLDPDNPLYSEDPFTALARHAALLPVRAPLPLDTLDLSLPEAMAASDSNAVRQVDHLRAPDPTTNATVSSDAPADGRSPAFDIFSASSGQLPASFAGLSLDLNDDLPMPLMPMPAPVIPAARREPAEPDGADGANEQASNASGASRVSNHRVSPHTPGSADQHAPRNRVAARPEGERFVRGKRARRLPGR